MEIQVYENILITSHLTTTDSITPDFRLRKGYRFLIRCHSRLQTFSKQRCMLLCDSSPTVIFISVFIRLNGAISPKKFFSIGKLSISFGSDRQLFQKQGLLMVKTNEIC